MLVCNEEIFSYLDTQFQHIEQQDGDSWKDKVSALHRCIENLPDIYKQSVHLTYLHDMKTSQIHSLNEIPKETLKKRIQRARKQLFVCLKEQGILRASQEVLV